MKRFLSSSLALGVMQAVALGVFSGTAAAGTGDTCPAPENYCYAAKCTGGCTTKSCNGVGNCDGTSSYKCYTCAVE